ncbi:MAG: periplasmic heavy metal sensor [Pseudomonadota bacterium]
MSALRQVQAPWGLIASLILNALLIGLLIGSALGQGPRQEPRAFIPGGDFEIVRGLERGAVADQRVEVRRALRQAYRATEDRRRRVAMARFELNRMLAADPYDALQTRKAFERLRAAEQAAKAGLHGALSDQFGALSLDERRSIVERLTSGERRGFGRLRGEGRRGSFDPTPRSEPPDLGLNLDPAEADPDPGTMDPPE